MKMTKRLFKDIIEQAKVTSEEFLEKTSLKNPDYSNNVTEAILQSFVAKALYDKGSEINQKALVLMETTNQDLRQAHAAQGGRLKPGPNANNSTSAMRYDLSYWNGTQCQGLIELKVNDTLNGLEKDVIGLSKALHEFGANYDGSLQWAALIVRIWRANPENTWNNREQPLRDFIDEEALSIDYYLVKNDKEDALPFGVIFMQSK